jgi:hypothetical protein
VHQGDLPPFAKEKGYQALARSRVVTASEVQIIFLIKQCRRLLRDFVAGRAYLPENILFLKVYDFICVRDFAINLRGYAVRSQVNKLFPFYRAVFPATCL